MSDIWHKKLAAWLHDPAEKCLVLFHDPAGHEGGTVKKLRAGLKDEIGLNFEALEAQVKKADWYAASADRPQWPIDVGPGNHQSWSRVDFAQEPVLIHPLSGDEINLNNLAKVDYAHIKDISLRHFQDILKLGKDAKMKFLALWRFAAENREQLGQLWSLLPADTRIPDHSIWNHLDLTSAFAGATDESDAISILSMAFGPVQSFIAQARSTSDLWAGSHLLSAIVWEGMKVIADEIGPDAFLFPQLRGLAVVDAWLLDLAQQAGCETEWRQQFTQIKAGWLNNRTDSNPLFAACLPNKFSAIVPHIRARELAEKATVAVRNAVENWAQRALHSLGLDDSKVAQEQLKQQLHGFPDIFWSAVEWTEDISNDSAALKKLKETYSIFVDEQDNFFNANETTYWQLLSQEVPIGGKKFWEPRTGVIYPAIYGLAEKTLAAAKAVRPFDQLPQQGFRCTLCGEREWLTDDRQQLVIPPGQRKNSATVWRKNAGKFGIKVGEHLCVICALKRLWPNLFTEKVREYLDDDRVGRYVVSTHTMSLIPTLSALANAKSMQAVEECCKLDRLLCDTDLPPVVLPKKMFRENATGNIELLKRIPAYIEHLRELDPADAIDNTDKSKNFYKQLEKIVGKDYRFETYYALILMDGDNMGAWLSATETDRRIRYSQAWHPKIRQNPDFLREKEKQGNEKLVRYLDALKTASPARHAAISQALNNFSSILVPHIIENEHNGKLIYAGGDDVLAMASTDDVLSIIQSLRMAYSGFGRAVEHGTTLDRSEKYAHKGFVLQNRRLLQVMGTRASTSVGVVIVHHLTPLSYALKCLREAEQTAKNAAGRNAFCLRILKRAGGEIQFTDNWWSTKQIPAAVRTGGFDENTSVGLFEKLIATLAATEKMSRKAFYAIDDWIHLLPEFSERWSSAEWESTQSMAARMLARQFSRHGASQAQALAEQVVALIWNKAKHENHSALRDPIKRLQDMLFCAEFFARETRSKKYRNTHTEGKETMK